MAATASVFCLVVAPGADSRGRATELRASFSGDWSVSRSFRTNPGVYTSEPGTWTWRQTGPKACGRYEFDGGGRSKGTVAGRTLSGQSNDAVSGRTTFTMTLAANGRSWVGAWRRGRAGGTWKGSRVGAATRSC